MDDRDLKVIESIYDALDDGRPERALVLARSARRELSGDDPVLSFLTGRALLEMDRPAEAVDDLQRAVELDPDAPEFRADLAECFFCCCRFDDALPHAQRAVALDDAFADAHDVLARLLERRGDVAGADRHFDHAARLDGEQFPPPCRVDEPEFGRQLERARALLPGEFREHLERVGVLVDELPSDELLFEESPPLNPDLLGLFVGVAIDGQSYLSPGGELPPRIYLFKRNLERSVGRPGELAAQIRDTLYHELGHYLGMDEEDLERADFA
jgi:predicted Zn-dependent protease with MMP-like domain